MTRTVFDKAIIEINGKRVDLFGECLKFESSAIANVEYHPFTSILEIIFTSGLKYAYFSVPQETYLKLAFSESKGQAFNQLIKDKFQYRKVK